MSLMIASRLEEEFIRRLENQGVTSSGFILPNLCPQYNLATYFLKLKLLLKRSQVQQLIRHNFYIRGHVES